MAALLKRAFFVAILAILCAGYVSPLPSSAQTTGLGWDGYTRQIWRGSAGQVAVWLIGPNLNLVDVVIYGPYAGWEPVSITTGNNNFSYLLWRTAAGNASVWILDANLNYVTGAASAAYPGWDPESLAMGTSNTNLRLTWRYVTGELALWSFDYQLDYLGGVTAGPYYGYDPGPAPEAISREPLSLRAPRTSIAHENTMPESVPRITALMKEAHAASVQRAARAMANLASMKKLPTLPRP